VIEDDMGRPLQLGGRKLQRLKDSHNVAEAFLLTETSTRFQQVYMSCTSCTIAKPTTKKQVLYTHLPTPERPCESISMDYILGIPSTKWGNDYVFVVVDRFSKMVILASWKNNITREVTAKLFFE
jgi:hypothetical protein